MGRGDTAGRVLTHNASQREPRGVGTAQRVDQLPDADVKADTPLVVVHRGTVAGVLDVALRTLALQPDPLLHGLVRTRDPLAPHHGAAHGRAAPAVALLAAFLNGDVLVMARDERLLVPQL